MSGFLFLRISLQKYNLFSETFPATLYTQGPPNSDDSETDDHIPLRLALKKAKKIISDDEDDWIEVFNLEVAWTNSLISFEGT